MFHLSQCSFLKLLDLSPEEITGLLDLAADLKAKKKPGSLMQYFPVKTLP